MRVLNILFPIIFIHWSIGTGEASESMNLIMNSLGDRHLLRRLEDTTSPVCDAKRQFERNLNKIYSASFSCDCASQGYATTVTCKSNGALNCGGISTHVSHVINFEYSMPELEVVCYTYTSGVSDWNGKPKCLSALYSGTTVYSCTVSVGGSACSSCTPCGKMSGSGAESMSFDCSNIPHNITDDKSVIVKYTCSDLNDPGKMKQLVCNGSSSLVGYLTATIAAFVIAYIGFS